MPKILVANHFNLLLEGGAKKEFAPGVHEVDEDVASHWYVQENATPIEDSADGDGAIIVTDPFAIPSSEGLEPAEFAAAVRSVADLAYQAAVTAMERYATLEGAAAVAETLAGLETDPSHLRLDPPDVSALIGGDDNDGEDEDELDGDDAPDAEAADAAGGDADPGKKDPDPAPELTPPPAAEGDPNMQTGTQDAPATEGEQSKAADAEQPIAPDFDAMDDDALRAFITKRDDKAPNGRLGRPKLLAMAKGEAADAAGE